MTKESIPAIPWGGVASLVALLLTATAAPVAGNAELPFFPGGNEILGSSRESVAEVLENLVEFVDAAQWQTFVASGAVSEGAALLALRRARDVLDGGEEGKTREGKPLPGIGLFGYFDYALDKVKYVRLGADAPVKATLDRNRALRCLENARKLAEAAGELVRSALEKSEGADPVRQAKEARYLFSQSKKGLDTDGNGEINGGECGLYEAGDIFPPARD